MYTNRDFVASELAGIRDAGLYKHEAALSSAQSAHIKVAGDDLINLCANNYLGLADNELLIAAAKDALDRWGFGMASVRFICGTQELHKKLEATISGFLHTDDTILYSSCFDANGGLFEVLCGAEDAIISDELNHASIIDGVRLSKARRLRYRNRDMADLEAQLQASQDARFRLIATDGVFSMDGYVAPLDEICDLAEKYDALVMVDDSHAVGFVGDTGAGTPERFGVQDRVDIVTGTLGKALGGASGGYTSGRAEIIELLRQRSRPYLFSNSLAPAIAAAAIATINELSTSGELLAKLNENTAWFRAEMNAQGFDIPASDHAIVPVMIGDAVTAARMADLIAERGVYVRAFSYPVVPQGRARIRTQMSAAHSRADLEKAVAAFVWARDEVARVDASAAGEPTPAAPAPGGEASEPTSPPEGGHLVLPVHFVTDDEPARGTIVTLDHEPSAGGWKAHVPGHSVATAGTVAALKDAVDSLVDGPYVWRLDLGQDTDYYIQLVRYYHEKLGQGFTGDEKAMGELRDAVWALGLNDASLADCVAILGVPEQWVRDVWPSEDAYTN